MTNEKLEKVIQVSLKENYDHQIPQADHQEVGEVVATIESRVLAESLIDSLLFIPLQSLFSLVSRDDIQIKKKQE